MNRKEYNREYYLKNKEKYLERQATPEYREKQKHYKKLRKERLREETQKENLIFIEENGLVEHPDYPGYYGTIDGKVFSNRGAYGKIRLVKPILQKNNNGYYLINCGRDKNGKRNQVFWHRFIAKTFIPNPNNLPEVNHLDEDKGNCCADNLEWCDRQHNMQHSLAKKYKVTNLKTGESFIIRNLSEWCRMENIDYQQANNVANKIRGKTVKQKTFTLEPLNENP